MNTGFRKAVARELEYKQHRDSAARPESRLKELSTNASASTVTIFSDGSPDASFHSAEDVAESKTTEVATNDAPSIIPAADDMDIDIDAAATASTPDEEFTFTALPTREPLTAKTPGTDTIKPSATSLRVQRIRQHLEKSSGGKFSSMIIDGDDDFTKSAAIEKKPQSASPVASRSPVAAPIVAHVAAPVAAPVQLPTSNIPGAIPPHLAHRQLNSPIKLRNPNTGSPSKVGSLYPPVSPSKSAAASSNHGHFFSGAIRRAKMLLFQDDKKENTPQTPKQSSANISRLMAPTASSQARSPVRASPSKLYPEIRSPTKIPEPRQPASPTRIASPVRVASGASSVASLDLNTPMVLRQPSVKAANTRSSRVPVPKAAERFTRRQAEIRAKEERERELKEKEAREKELQKELREKELAAAVAEREQARLVAAAEEQRQRQAAAEKEAQLEQERKERAERAQRARRERLLRERQERKEKEEREEKEREEKERVEREERLEQERLQKERLEQERQQERLEHERLHQRLHQEQMERERLEQERIQEELLEEARLESIRLEKENQQRLQQQRKRPSAVADDEQQQPQKVHLSNMRKPLSSSTRVSQNHRVSSSMVDSPLTKPAGGSLMRQSLQRQQYKTQMGMAQSKFGKAAEGVTISTESIKFASSSSSATASSAASSAATAAAAAATAAATPLKRVVGPNRPQHTTPQQFRSQRTGAFSSSMSFQAKLFKQSASAAPTSAPTPVAADPMTPAASHVPVTQLPEINSDSEDDEGDGILRDWANSPELRSLLQRQQGMDPDRIFGPLPPLQMEEIFGNSNTARVAKFRGRSSSANWSRDQLSQFEIDSYSEQMGYK